MKKLKLIAAGVFMFGLGLGGTAAAGVASITPEMAQCIASCQAAGGAYTPCWNCCVRKICAVD